MKTFLIIIFCLSASANPVTVRDPSPSWYASWIRPVIEKPVVKVFKLQIESWQRRLVKLLGTLSDSSFLGTHSSTLLSAHDEFARLPNEHIEKIVETYRTQKEAYESGRRLTREELDKYLRAEAFLRASGLLDWVNEAGTKESQDIQPSPAVSSDQMPQFISLPTAAAPAASGAATTESLGDMAAEAFFASQIPAVIGLSPEDSSPENVELLKPIRVLRADLWKDHVSGCSIVKKQLISKKVPQELAHSIWLRLQEIFCVDTANLFFVPGSFVGNPISRDSVAQILELFTGIGVNAGPSTAYIDPMSELSAAFTASGIRVTMPDSITTTQNCIADVSSLSRKKDTRRCLILFVGAELHLYKDLIRQLRNNKTPFILVVDPSCLTDKDREVLATVTYLRWPSDFPIQADLPRRIKDWKRALLGSVFFSSHVPAVFGLPNQNIPKELLMFYVPRRDLSRDKGVGDSDDTPEGGEIVVAQLRKKNIPPLNARDISLRLQKLFCGGSAALVWLLGSEFFRTLPSLAAGGSTSASAPSFNHVFDLFREIGMQVESFDLFAKELSPLLSEASTQSAKTLKFTSHEQVIAHIMQLMHSPPTLKTFVLFVGSNPHVYEGVIRYLKKHGIRVILVVESEGLQEKDSETLDLATVVLRWPSDFQALGLQRAHILMAPFLQSLSGAETTSATTVQPEAPPAIAHPPALPVQPEVRPEVTIAPTKVIPEAITGLILCIRITLATDKNFGAEYPRRATLKNVSEHFKRFNMGASLKQTIQTAVDEGCVKTGKTPDGVEYIEVNDGY